MQVRLGRTARPIVFGIFETMQRRGEDVVEVVEVARGQQALAVEEAGVLGEFGQRARLHRAQEHRRIAVAAKAAADRPPAGGQVDRRADSRDAGGNPRSAVASLLGPAQQRVAAERDAGREQWLQRAFAQAGQDPADLLKIARVVGARCQVQLARAAAKVRGGKVQAGFVRDTGEGLDVLTARRTFKAVEDDQPARIGVCMFQIDVDEVAIRGMPAFAHEGGWFAREATRKSRSPDRLRMAAGQPPRRAIALHQCSVVGASLISGSSRAVPGLAWCATRRQPCAVFR